MAKRRVLVFCAHPDDEIFGVGGTIAKYTSDGIEAITVIFSSGAGISPFLKPNVLVEIRKEESLAASELVGSKETFFLGLPDGKLKKNLIDNKEIKEKLNKMIKKYKPEKIFTHANDDPHPDHKAVNKFTTELLKDLNYEGSIYSFDVWNPINLKKRNLPRMYVDITETFEIKLKALKMFQSQKMSLVSLMPVVLTRAIKSGLQAKTKYAEMFYKIQ